jgi:hypothetical protein
MAKKPKKAAPTEIYKSSTERLELALRFRHRAEMIRDFLMVYQALCCPRIVAERGMTALVDQFIEDVLKVEKEFGGRFPLAIGENDAKPGRAGEGDASTQGAAALDIEEEEGAPAGRTVEDDGAADTRAQEDEDAQSGAESEAAAAGASGTHDDPTPEEDQ